MNRASFLGMSASALVAQTAPTALVVSPLTGPDDASLYYAQQQGWFRDAGLDVTIQPLTNGSAGMSAVVGGSVQIAFGNVLSLSDAHVKGVPITLIAPGSGYDSNAASILLLTGGSSTIHTARDLSGKTVAVPSLVDLISIAVRSWIDQNGGDSTQVHFIELAPGVMVAALQSQRVDAICVYDPFVSIAEGQGARVIAQPLDAIAPTFMVTVWFAYGPWATSHRDVVRSFVTVVQRGAAYVNGHRQELLPMISDYSRIPIETLRRMKVVPIPSTLATSLIQPVINAAAKYHAIPAAFPAKDMIF